MEKTYLKDLNYANEIINLNIKPILDRVLLFSIKPIIQNSNFDSVNKYVWQIFNPELSFKNNIFSWLNRSLNNVKFNNIPIVSLLINKEHYLLINNIKDIKSDFEITSYDKIFFRDLFIFLLEINTENENIKLLRYYFLYFYILYLMNFQWANLFLFIRKNDHWDYFIQLLDFLYQKILLKVQSWKFLDVGNTFYTYYSNYIYWDIIEFKYKNYNKNIDNIELYKFLHVLFKKDENIPEDIFRILILEKIDKKWWAKIHDKYKSEEYLKLMYDIYTNPYWLSDFWLLDEKELDSYWYEENILENNIFSYEYIENIIQTFWVKNNDTIFYTIYFLLFTKISSKKDKILIYKKIMPLIENFFSIKSWKEESNRYLISIYNLLIFSRLYDEDNYK